MRALNNDRRVVDDADVECARRQDELVVRGVVTTDRDREIEIQGLFENPLLVCGFVVESSWLWIG